MMTATARRPAVPGLHQNAHVPQDAAQASAMYAYEQRDRTAEQGNPATDLRDQYVPRWGIRPDAVGRRPKHVTNSDRDCLATWTRLC